MGTRIKEVEDSAEKPGVMPPVGSSWHLHAGGPPTSAQVDAALKAYDKVFDGGSRIPPMKAALTAAAEVAAINRDADVSTRM